MFRARAGMHGIGLSLGPALPAVPVVCVRPRTGRTIRPLNPKARKNRIERKRIRKEVIGNKIPAVASADITIDFEYFVGKDGVLINNYYTGVSFTGSSTGQSWRAADGSTGFYPFSSAPSGDILSTFSGDVWIDGLVAAWTGDNSNPTVSNGDNGRIDFVNADATFVKIDYCSANEFFLEAYDAGGNFLTFASGQPNLRFGDLVTGYQYPLNSDGPGTLQVDATGIAYVIVHDHGDYWMVDNITTDATGIVGPPTAVPAPGAILLAGIGMGIVSWLRNRRTL
jgi:hypothetical protein